MAKKQSLEKKRALKAQSIQKRTERAREESAILNKCLGLLAVLAVAEVYFLLCYRFLVQGTFRTVAIMSDVVGAVSWIGAAVLVLGVVLAVMRRGKKYFHSSLYLALLGAVLFVGGRLMLTIYPSGTTVMCVAVPLLAVAGFVYYLYQHEFFCAGLGLGLAIFGMWFVRRAAGSASFGGSYQIIAFVLLAMIVALLALTVVIGRNGGQWGKEEKMRKIFSGTTNYNIAYASLVAAAAGLLIAIFASSAALYLMWAGIALLFVLAVYYTIHLM